VKPSRGLTLTEVVVSLLLISLLAIVVQGFLGTLQDHASSLRAGDLTDARLASLLHARIGHTPISEIPAEIALDHGGRSIPVALMIRRSHEVSRVWIVATAGRQTVVIARTVEEFAGGRADTLSESLGGDEVDEAGGVLP